MTTTTASEDLLGTLEDEVHRLLGAYAKRIRDDKASKYGRAALSDMSGEIARLQRVLNKHEGRSETVCRTPYKIETTRVLNEEELEESHESFGLIRVSRCSAANTRLFGSSSNHPLFFSLSISTAKRVLGHFGERIHSERELIEVSLSPAQFVDMITSQNLGEGVPCTIERYNGLTFERVPPLKSEIDAFVDTVSTDLKNLAKELDSSLVKVDEILAKKSLTKDDKEVLRRVVTGVQRFLSDRAPHAGQLLVEMKDGVVTRGKQELDAFLQFAVYKTGIKAIEDAGGVLKLPAPSDTKVLKA